MLSDHLEALRLLCRNSATPDEIERVQLRKLKALRIEERDNFDPEEQKFRAFVSKVGPGE